MSFRLNENTFKMLINGRLEEAPTTFDVINPAYGKVFAKAPECSKEQLNLAMEAAKAAFPAWSKDIGIRKEAILKASEILQAHAHELAELLTQEQGKPLAKAQYEAFGTSAILGMHASFNLERELLFEDEQKKIELIYKPMGVVAAITPWNYPLFLAILKIAPCLLAGNTLVLKPSPYTPLTTLKLGELLKDVFPKGVLNILSGSNQLGAWMTEHPVPRKISFTGSVATGKKIAMAAAPDLKRVTLELGGNDVAIVLNDVDPETIAAKIFSVAFENSGQVCIASKRIFIQEGVYDKTVAELVKLAKKAKTGDGLDPESELGPLNNKAQYDRVLELLADAKKQGGTIETGGENPSHEGYFISPAIVTNVREGIRLVDEEQFGPALPVMKFKTIDEVVERANNTMYALGGSIWSNDLELANQIAARLETGSVWINHSMDLTPMAPFGGAKWSGIGQESGIWGVKSYCEQEVVNTSKLKI